MVNKKEEEKVHKIDLTRTRQPYLWRMSSVGLAALFLAKSKEEGRKEVTQEEVSSFIAKHTSQDSSQNFIQRINLALYTMRGCNWRVKFDSDLLEIWEKSKVKAKPPQTQKPPTTEEKKAVIPETQKPIETKK